MLQELITALRERTLLKWILLGGAAVILVIVILSIVLQPRYERYTLGTTPFTTSGFSFASLEGTDLYAFNGASFYKFDVTSPDNVTVLNSGVKLPVPGFISWADDKGALLNFKESFALTKVDRVLSGSGEALDESAMNHTWYFNFENGSLRKVHEKPLIFRLAVYSADRHGFYYVPDLFFTPPSEAGDAAPENIPLNFYDIASNKSEEIVHDLDLLDITHINVCHDESYRVCLVGRDSDDIQKLRLYAINQSGDKEVLLESDARLVPTNDPGLFITTAGIPEDFIHEDEDDPDHEHIEPDVDFSPSPAILHNLGDGTTSNLGFDIAGEEIIPYFSSLDDFYFLSDQSASLDRGESVFRTGATSIFGSLTTKEFSLRLNNGEPYSDSFGTWVDYGSNGMTLITSVKGEQLLFAPDKLSVSDISAVDQGEAQRVVRSCAESHAQSNEYFSEGKLFRVFFVNNNRFERNTKAFVDCLESANSKVFVGYDFYIGALDPGNGRIVSD